MAQSERKTVVVTERGVEIDGKIYVSRFMPPVGQEVAYQVIAKTAFLYEIGGKGNVWSVDALADVESVKRADVLREVQGLVDEARSTPALKNGTKEKLGRAAMLISALLASIEKPKPEV